MAMLVEVTPAVIFVLRLGIVIDSGEGNKEVCNSEVIFVDCPIIGVRAEDAASKEWTPANVVRCKVPKTK